MAWLSAIVTFEHAWCTYKWWWYYQQASRQKIFDDAKSDLAQILHASERVGKSRCPLDSEQWRIPSCGSPTLLWLPSLQLEVRFCAFQVTGLAWNGCSAFDEMLIPGLVKIDLCTCHRKRLTSDLVESTTMKRQMLCICDDLAWYYSIVLGACLLQYYLTLDDLKNAHPQFSSLLISHQSYGLPGTYDGLRMVSSHALCRYPH